MIDGGLAFPRAAIGPNAGYIDVCGMTLRDYFAGQALAGLFTNSDGDWDYFAKCSYRMADAMLEKRQEEKNGKEE